MEVIKPNTYKSVDGTDMLGKDAMRVREYFINEVMLAIPFSGDCPYPKPDGEISEELGIARSYIVRVRKHYNIPDVETRRKTRFTFLQETATNYYNLYTSGVDQYIELKNRILKEKEKSYTAGSIIGVIAGVLLTVFASLLF